MKISCPVCNNADNLEFIKGEKTIKVRQEPIIVKMECYRCPECGEEFRVLDPKSDPFDQAYRSYRAKHRMLQPEDIRTFRRKYGLTQGELANLLGLGGATLSRYERGQLQNKTHDMLIKMAMDPLKLRELVYNSTDIFQPEKRNKILQTIEGIADSRISLFERVAATFQHHEADEYSGFKKFDSERFLGAVLYFCKGGVFKTKLNKLLFYADFKHFEEYTVSITGTRYAHVPFGPAPDGYDLYYPLLIHQGAIEVEEILYEGKDYTGEKYYAKKEPDLNTFSNSELRVLAYVKEYFESHNASDVSDLSHMEKGYRETDTGELISYRFAQDLKI